MSLCVLLLAAITAAPGAVAANSATAASPRWEVAADLVDRLTDRTTRNPNGASATVETIGGVRMPAIFQHPAATGAPLVSVTFPDIVLPALRKGEKLEMQFSVGIRGGFPRNSEPKPDGVAFLVRIDGREAFRRVWAQQQWHAETIDLTNSAGKRVLIELNTDPLTNSAYDWAAWGMPRIVVVGRHARLRPIARIGGLEIRGLLSEKLPVRLVSVQETPRAVSLVATNDLRLDLPAQLEDMAKQVGPAPVSAVPEMIAGEGADPRNHTVVRILSRWGIARAQFLAFEPRVRGGVSVTALTLADGTAAIAATPLADAAVRQIRLFDRDGARIGTIVPPAWVTPPYTITAGRFLSGHVGQQLAVASAGESTDRRIAILAPDGHLVASRVLPETVTGPLQLAAQPRTGGVDQLLAYLSTSRSLVTFDGEAPTTQNLSFLPGGAHVFPGSKTGTLVATLPDAAASRIMRIGPAGERDTQDVGAYENLFWIQWYGKGWGTLPDGKHVRQSVFLHLRTDGASAGTRNPNLGAKPADWTTPDAMRSILDRIGAYDREAPALWEPCFTHRQARPVFAPWRDAIDRHSGLPRYMMLTRKNHVVEYGEFGSVDFNASTYAFGLPELDRLYLWPLRAALRALAPAFRANPEHMAGLEPNHEHEIAVEADGTMGDCNPAMIAGFFQYLRQRYGNLDAINRAMRTHFRDAFDAPRNMDRGAWDSYAPSNPFFAEWVAYNRYVVSARVAQTFREALLAGFPPEIIKCHQIPDTYAVGNLSAFSDITARFTPIDYMLNAGVGYGFTRYGVWYNRPHDALQDAHAAGFDAISLGEYQALHPDPQVAYNQLRYMLDHGAVSVHCMDWPPTHDRGFNAAMDSAARRLLEEDPPRPGLTGGVEQMRVAEIGGNVVDVACIGSGPSHTGLLKSLRPDGSWEGSVYVVPFHAHVDVTNVPMKTASSRKAFSVTTSPLRELDSGVQIEITFQARDSHGGVIRFAARKGDRPLPGLMRDLRVSTGWRWYHVTYRAQTPEDGVEIALSTVHGSPEVRSVLAVRHTERTPKLSRGRLDAQRHGGAVTFDVLP